MFAKVSNLCTDNIKDIFVDMKNLVDIFVDMKKLEIEI